MGSNQAIADQKPFPLSEVTVIVKQLADAEKHLPTQSTEDEVRQRFPVCSFVVVGGPVRLTLFQFKKNDPVIICTNRRFMFSSEQLDDALKDVNCMETGYDFVGRFLTLLCAVTGERGIAVLGYEALRDFFGGSLADALLGALP